MDGTCAVCRALQQAITLVIYRIAHAALPSTIRTRVWTHRTDGERAKQNMQHVRFMYTYMYKRSCSPASVCATREQMRANFVVDKRERESAKSFSWIACIWKWYRSTQQGQKWMFIYLSSQCLYTPCNPLFLATDGKRKHGIKKAANFASPWNKKTNTLPGKQRVDFQYDLQFRSFPLAAPSSGNWLVKNGRVFLSFSFVNLSGKLMMILYWKFNDKMENHAFNTNWIEQSDEIKIVHISHQSEKITLPQDVRAKEKKCEARTSGKKCKSTGKEITCHLPWQWHQ